MFAVPADHATSEFRMEKLDWRFSEVCGRTILFKSPSTGIGAAGTQANLLALPT